MRKLFNLLFKKKEEFVDGEDFLDRIPFFNLNMFTSISYDVILDRDKDKNDEFKLVFSFWLNNEETNQNDRGFKLLSQYAAKTKEELSVIVRMLYMMNFAGHLKTHTIGHVYGSDFVYEIDWQMYDTFALPPIN